jgi:hypothetical protein
MTEYKYICLNHRFWVDSHPKEAFTSVNADDQTSRTFATKKSA